MKHLAQIQREFLKQADNFKLHVMKYFADPESSNKDEDFHAYAEKLSMKPDELENVEHSIMKSFFGQGRYNEVKDKKPIIDPKELAMGVKVEMEHTNDPEIAKRISLDHLSEISDYYTRLAALEAEGKKAGKETKYL